MTLSGLSVCIPCYKEDNKLVTDMATELQNLGAEVIVIDDGGFMDLPLTVGVLTHQPNMGYGYALKRGIRAATNDIICTADGDGEHRIEDIVKLYTVYNLINKCSMIVGCRWNLNEKPIRWFGRKAINFIAACWSWHMLPDLNSGMRIFDRNIALGYEPILCDTFSFTTSLSMAMVTDNHKIAWFPIDNNPRTYGASRVKVIRDGLITLWFIFYIGFALRTRKFRAFLRRLFHV